MKNTLKKLGIISAATFVVALSFFAGLYANAEKATITGNSAADLTMTGAPSDVDFSTFWKAWQILQTKYVPTGVAATTTVTSQDKVYGAISGLTASLGDPYTVFLTPDQAKNFTGDLSGTLEGIGAVLNVKDTALTVVSVIATSPAEKAGLKAGDQIMQIGSTTAVGIDISKAVGLVRGPKGTTVTLLIKRQGVSNFSVNIVRDTITTPIITTKSYPSGVFYIDVASFTSNSADLFRDALRKFVNSGDTHLVIDLRDNGGGYLDAAVDMASWFLPAGNTVVTEDYGKNADPTIYRSKGYNLFKNNTKVTILVNGNSASASEIFTGALKDYGKAVIVGEKTYGKGSVQELVPLTADTLLKVTVARWLTPAGTSISLNGINPDYEVKLSDDDIKAQKDPQLDKALSIAAGL